MQNAVETHNAKDWAAIAELVSSRTTSHPSIDQMTGRTGAWKEAEDIKLEGAVHMHGGKNWSGIAALVPDRTNNQCYNRWRLDAIRVIGQKGKTPT
jgi:hypothetical protein